jgi:excisionase family DNA binding protein
VHIEPMVLGVKDAATFIGLSRSRLYELIADGHIEARKLGARTVVPTASLRAFVDAAPRLQAEAA